MSMADKPNKRSQGFTFKKRATVFALLAAKAEAKTDAAAAWAGDDPLDDAIPHGGRK
jgi:hypothetical protein